MRPTRSDGRWGATTSSRRIRVRASAALLLVLSLLTILAASPGSADPGNGKPRHGWQPNLADEVIQRGVKARGPAVREAPGLRVEQVSVARGPQAPEGEEASGLVPLYRVELKGPYRPRDAAYVMTADGDPFAYGVPSRDATSLVGVTDEAAVLDAAIRVDVEAGVDLSDEPIESAGPAEASPAVGSGAAVPGTSSPAAAGESSTVPSGAVGPYAVERLEYDLGDEAFLPSRFVEPVEVRGVVHAPVAGPGGPYPIVLILPGNHETCFKGGEAYYEWPCSQGSQPLPNEAGYDYLARRLASHGYVVVAVSANGVNVFGGAIRGWGMPQRAELLAHHLSLWGSWGSGVSGPFGSRFTGEVDVSRVGLMGHSRGGEGVLYGVQSDGALAGAGVDAVMTIAQTSTRATVVTEIPFGVLLSYCDGDTGLTGVGAYDRSRYALGDDPAPKHLVTVPGANHNYFNSVWSPGGGYPGGWNDAGVSCDGPLSESQQRKVGLGYLVGFYRSYLGGESGLGRLWAGAAVPLQVADFVRPSMTTMAPADHRIDVATFAAAGSDETGDLGGIIERGASLLWCAPGVTSVPCFPDEVMDDSHEGDVGRGVMRWTKEGTGVRIGLGSGGLDARAMDALQFRVVTQPVGANDDVRAQSLRVVLTDEDGDRAVWTSRASERWSLRTVDGPGEHYLMTQIRIPLDEFDGVSLSRLRSVSLRAGEEPRGEVAIADLAFTAI